MIRIKEYFHLHEAYIDKAILEENGFVIKRKGMTSVSFYYSRILEAVRSVNS